jgi:Concanavalin A-like lectin/glucanases superfamily
MTRLGAWNFDEASGDVLDASGNGWDFALTSPTIRTNSGHTDKGLTQSGSDIFLLSPTIMTALKTPNRTLAAWIKETSPVTGWVGEFYVSSIDSGSWGILFLSSQWNFQARNASGFARCSVARPTDSLFHHVAGTYDGSNLRLYLDAVLVSTQPLAGPLRTDANEFRFLQNTSSSVIVDDVQFFDEALSQSDIATLMTTPVVLGRSGKPKIWSGSTWNARQAKVWNGSSWDNALMHGRNGTSWITAK